MHQLIQVVLQFGRVEYQPADSAVDFELSETSMVVSASIQFQDLCLIISMTVIGAVTAGEGCLVVMRDKHTR